MGPQENRRSLWGILGQRTTEWLPGPQLLFYQLAKLRALSTCAAIHPGAARLGEK